MSNVTGHPGYSGVPAGTHIVFAGPGPGGCAFHAYHRLPSDARLRRGTALPLVKALHPILRSTNRVHPLTLY